MAQQYPTAPTRIIRGPQVQTCTGLGRSTIYDKLDPESSSFDPTFPKQVSIGLRAVGWVEAEIEAWIQRRIAESRNIPKQENRPKSRGTARRVTRDCSGAVSDTTEAPEAVRADVCTAFDPTCPSSG